MSCPISPPSRVAARCPSCRPGDPLPAGLGRGADPGVVGSAAVAQGLQVGPVLVDPCAQLTGAADGPVAGDDDVGVARHVLDQPQRGEVVLDRVLGERVEHGDEDVGEHVAGDEHAALLDQQRRVAGGVRGVLDDPDARAVPRDPRRLGGQAGDAAEHVVQRHLLDDVLRDHPGDERPSSRGPTAARGWRPHSGPCRSGATSPNPACQSRWSQCGCVEKPATTAGPTTGRRDAGQLVGEHPGVDEQDARPAVHDHGVALQELALVDEHPVGDLPQHQRAPRSDRVVAHRDARVERPLVEQVELDRPVVVVEQRPAEAEDRGMGGEQQLVEEPCPEQLGGERRPAHADDAVGLGPQGGELLDRVVPADDPGVVVGAVPGAGDEHLGLGGPDLAVLAQDVRQRRVLARPRQYSSMTS